MLCLVASMMVFSFGCTKKSTTIPSVNQGLSQEDLDRQRAEQAARDAALAEQNLSSQQAEMMRAAREGFSANDILFDFDSAILNQDAIAVLQTKAEWLRQNEGDIIIEGHCDERGTNEYNLALGDRRAMSAKTFLVDLGISAARVRTVSYGEERPIDPDSSEAAWIKNRRAHFVVIE
ncbi:MAG: OmpA family protein [Desulfobacteraceae bacterium]|nr:OmpA family protein [Desulfobacteraceae bacterium]MBU4055237.1 OmpA family protein [Pseudomonadota bacterium]